MNYFHNYHCWNNCYIFFLYYLCHYQGRKNRYINKYLDYNYKGTIELHTKQIKNFLDKENPQINNASNNNINSIYINNQNNNNESKKEKDLNNLSNQDK